MVPGTKNATTHLQYYNVKRDKFRLLEVDALTSNLKIKSSASHILGSKYTLLSYIWMFTVTLFLE